MNGGGSQKQGREDRIEGGGKQNIKEGDCVAKSLKHILIHYQSLTLTHIKDTYRHRFPSHKDTYTFLLSN